MSKYTYVSLFNFPKITTFNFNVVLHYKQKQKYFLFINIIILLFFFNPNIKTRFLFKISPVTLLQITLRNQNFISNFINNFVYVYLPLIDSFSAEFKNLQKKNIIKFIFFKFPLLIELNTLFTSLEHLQIFLNTYKFQLEFHFKKTKNLLSNYNFLQ